MSCNRTVIVDPSAISWGAIGNRLAIGRRLVGDCILSVCVWLQKVCNFLEIGRQPIGDWSAISQRLKIVSGLSATNKNLSTIDLVAERFSLAATKTSLRPNRPFNLLQPPCNLPATTRNLGRKKVADRLHGMCDRGLNQCCHIVNCTLV